MHNEQFLFVGHNQRGYNTFDLWVLTQRSQPDMAGHPVFHEATVYFTVEYVNSLPKKLSEYKDVIRTSFKLTLVEGGKLDIGDYFNSMILSFL